MHLQRSDAPCRPCGPFAAVQNQEAAATTQELPSTLTWANVEVEGVQDHRQAVLLFGERQTA